MREKISNVLRNLSVFWVQNFSSFTMFLERLPWQLVLWLIHTLAMVPYRSFKNWESFTGMVEWINPRRKKSAYVKLPMGLFWMKKSGARGYGPPVKPYLLRHLWPAIWGHVAMRASFLLDPWVPILMDFLSTWIAPPMEDLVFASSYEERVPSYLKQRKASLSSDKDPNP